MKVRFLYIFLAVLLLSPLIVAAQTGGTNPCTNGGELGRCVSQIYVWSLGLSVLLALGASVYGGYLVMTAHGNGSRSSEGKQYLTSSIVGLVLLFGAYLLLNTINSDLTRFTSPTFENFRQQKPGETPPPPSPTSQPGDI